MPENGDTNQRRGTHWPHCPGPTVVRADRAVVYVHGGEILDTRPLTLASLNRVRPNENYQNFLTQPQATLQSEIFASYTSVWCVLCGNGAEVSIACILFIHT